MKILPRSGSLLFAFFLAQTDVLFAQGLLGPPAAPAPTMKTLDQVEARIPIPAAAPGQPAVTPFVIGTAGSYYLTRNLIVTSGNAINVTADNVTIDLNGFTLRGPGSAGNGISITGAGASVRNGVITGWSRGIDAETAKSGTFERLRIHNNASHGLIAGDACRASEILAENNGGAGINATFHANISRCTARNNTSVTFGGILTGAHARVSDCQALGNAGNGFGFDSGSIITGCVGTANALSGFNGTDSRIENCTASFNTTHGIRVQSGSTVIGNRCADNGFGAGDGAGINVVADKNRIEGNTVIDNDRGIDVNLNGQNLILRNHAVGSTGTGSPSANYDIAGGNILATIVSTEAAFNAAANANVNVSQ